MQIERGFQNNYGENFANIVNVGFSSLRELRNFLGEFITETKKDESVLYRPVKSMTEFLFFVIKDAYSNKL